MVVVAAEVTAVVVGSFAGVATKSRNQEVMLLFFCCAHNYLMDCTPQAARWWWLWQRRRIWRWFGNSCSKPSFHICVVMLMPI